MAFKETHSRAYRKMPGIEFRGSEKTCRYLLDPPIIFLVGSRLDKAVMAVSFFIGEVE
jgi:hypothetical protein